MRFCSPEAPKVLFKLKVLYYKNIMRRDSVYWDVVAWHSATLYRQINLTR